MKDNYVIRKNVIVHNTENESVLLDMNTGKYYGLDFIGTEIFNLIQKGEELRTIEEIFMLKYNLEKRQIEMDLEKFINNLLKKKLIRRKKRV
ncbi:PqqD family protein [Paenibacillus sp. p3-SID867]|uniref:PqqD family protein n=1 Tax=Paenibacillus sp. p3-SID867 TaxID=2916363 RepID=UPI0021A8B26F|nr:PqqD family protein [Paenibacillus sp. p3-SID867]MCT1403812.1 PqqD family protein [Paenibacillus sp. p3-SID867]